MLLTPEFKQTQKNHFLHWNGSVATDWVILSLTGSESVSSPYCFEVRSLTDLNEKEITAMQGQGISCQIGGNLDKYPQRYIHGVVTHIRRERNADDNTLCVLRLEPAFALLRMGRSMRVWQNMTVPDVVRKLLGECGIHKVDSQLHNTYQKREYCVQYRESDFDFISRVLEEEGIYYFFRHEENLHQMVLADHPASHVTAKDSTLLWHHQGSILTIGNIEKWWSRSQLTPSEVALHGYNMEQASEITGRYKSTSESTGVDFVNYTDVSPFTERTMLSDKAKSAMEALDANTVVYVATVNAYWLTCGEVFTLTDHPEDNGSYRIQTLTFDATNNFENSAGDYHCEFHSLRHSVKWRPVCTRFPVEVAGILTAKVVGPLSEEIHTDEFGRIKILFPWDMESKSDGANSCWVRVSQPWVGNKFGVQFIPRVGSEVLVSFVQGNPDFPLVTGSVYNGQNKLPFSLPDNKTESGFVTHSPKGSIAEGHRISLSDEKGQEKLTITSQRDLLLTANNNLVSNVTKEVQSKVGANRKTQITKGNDTLELQEGSLFLTIRKGNVIQNVLGDFTTNLEGGQYMLKTKNGGVNVNTDNTCVIESMQSIELKTGSSMISLSPAGISISGPMITIEGVGATVLKGSTVMVKGDGMATVTASVVDVKPSP